VMEQIADRPDAELIQIMLLRSMKQATYTPDNEGHFGLALEEYSHFTSPIRRYPDLILHRVIRYLLEKQEGDQSEQWTAGGGYCYKIEELDQLGVECSTTERRADEATRDVSDWLKCEFMQDHVGDTFEAVVASVTHFGMFVRLNDLFIDGLVHISSLGSDYYQYDNMRQRLVGEASGQVYQIGDTVTVKVAAVNLDDRQIDLMMEGDSAGGKRRKPSKPMTARERVNREGAKLADKEKSAAKGKRSRSGSKNKSSSGAKATTTKTKASATKSSAKKAKPAKRKTSKK